MARRRVTPGDESDSESGSDSSGSNGSSSDEDETSSRSSEEEEEGVAIEVVVPPGARAGDLIQARDETSPNPSLSPPAVINAPRSRSLTPSRPQVRLPAAVGGGEIAASVPHGARAGDTFDVFI